MGGQLNKKSQKVTVYPGAVYNIKIRTRPEVGWSGPATLKLVGDRDQTEAIAIEAKLKKNFVYKFTHEDKKIDNITSLYFDFKKKKYNDFIEAIKIESGREVTGHDGDLFAVYEEVVNIK